MNRERARIRLTGIECLGRIGVSQPERCGEQKLLVNVELGLDLEPASNSDRLELTLDYAEVVRLVRQEVAHSQYRLLEALASHLTQLLMALPRVGHVTLEVEKFPADLAGQVEKVSVQVSQSHTAG